MGVRHHGTVHLFLVNDQVLGGPAADVGNGNGIAKREVCVYHGHAREIAMSYEM